MREHDVDTNVFVNGENSGPVISSDKRTGIVTIDGNGMGQDWRCDSINFKTVPPIKEDEWTIKDRMMYDTGKIVFDFILSQK